MDAARLMQPLQERTAVQSKPAIPRRRGEHTMQHVSTLPAVLFGLGGLAGLPLYTALREGMCGETPCEVVCFPSSIRHWHFATKIAQNSILLASERVKTAGSCRQRKFSFRS